MFIMPLRRGRKGAFTGAKAIALVLLAAGLMLMAFIVMHGTGIYKSSRAAEEKQGLSSVQCVGFLYTISDIKAAPDSLEFELKNEISSTDDIHNLTILVGNQSKQTVTVNILVGSSATVSVPLSVRSNFTLYPDNCQIYPARCRISGDCAYH